MDTPKDDKPPLTNLRSFVETLISHQDSPEGVELLGLPVTIGEVEQHHMSRVVPLQLHPGCLDLLPRVPAPLLRICRKSVEPPIKDPPRRDKG